jgi:hypothetical protein
MWFDRPLKPIAEAYKIRTPEGTEL